MNRASFYAALRAPRGLFGGQLRQSEVTGIEAILDKAEATNGLDPRWLAYMLATTFHETAKTMQPVRETLSDTDDKAIAILERTFADGKLPWVKTPYWRKDTAGKSWLGRGLVQLTHKSNYEKLGKAIGVDLLTDPDKAMELPVAVDIMFAGMTKGLFTTHKLSDYFGDHEEDWTEARRIINGLERAGVVAGYGRTFYAAIKAAA